LNSDIITLKNCHNLTNEDLINSRFPPFDYQKEAVNQLVNDIDETLLACLAAGVPSNLISVSKAYEQDSFTIKQDIRFTGRL